MILNITKSWNYDKLKLWHKSIIRLESQNYDTTVSHYEIQKKKKNYGIKRSILCDRDKILKLLKKVIIMAF